MPKRFFHTVPFGVHPVTVPDITSAPSLGPLAVAISDAAKLIGVSPRTLRTLTTEKKVPHVRLGARVLFPVDALREWLREQTIKPA
jgi:excisionase family DNA binding protein